MIIMSTTTTAFGVTRALLWFNVFHSDLLEIRQYAICILFSGERSFIRSTVNQWNNKSFPVRCTWLELAPDIGCILLTAVNVKPIKALFAFLLFEKGLLFMNWLTGVEVLFSTLANTGFIFTGCRCQIKKERKRYTCRKFKFDVSTVQRVMKLQPTWT